MMRKLRTVRYYFYFVLAVLAIVITVVLTLDFGRFKSHVETYASETLGRTVRIDGPLYLTFGRNVDLRAENVRVASTDWSTSPELVSIEHLETRIDAWSLLRETAIVDYLAINGLRINLERNAKDLGNWASLFGPETSETPVGPSRHLPAIVRNLDIVNSTVAYTTPDRPRAAILTVPHGTARVEDSERLQVEAVGDLNGAPLVISLDAGSVQEIIELAAAEIAFSISLGEAYFEGNAAFTDLLQPSRPTVRVEVAGPSIEYLTDILEIGGIASGPMNLSLSIEPAGEHMRLSLSGDVGEFALSANGQFDDLQRLERAEIEFTASGPSARRIGDLLGRRDLPDAAFDASGTIRRAGSDATLEDIRVAIGDTQLVVEGQFYDLPDPSMSNASLRISGPDIGQFGELLGVPGQLDGPFDIVADLRALETGGARFDMTGTVKTIGLTVEGWLADFSNFVGSELRADFAGPDLRVVTRAAGYDVGPAEPFAIEMSLSNIDGATVLDRGLGRIGEDLFGFSGRIVDGPSVEWSVLFEATISDLAARLASFGIDYAGVPAGTADASGAIRSADSGYVLDDVAVAFAGAEISLEGRFGQPPDLEASDLEIRASGSSLARLLPERDELGELDRPFSATATARIGEGELIIENAALEINRTRLRGRLAFELADIPERGQFSIETNSPAVLELWPLLADLSVGPAEPFVLRVAGDWSGSNWSIDELDVGFAGGSLAASGRTTDPPRFDDTSFSVDWRIPSLSNLGTLARRDLPDQPARSQFELTGDREELTISILSAVLGSSDVRGEIAIRTGDEVTIEADLTSDLIDLTPYFPSAAERAVEAEEERISPDGRWIPDLSVEIDALQGFAITAYVQVADIRVRDRSFNNVALEASILNGQLRFDSFNIETDGGALHGMATLRPGADAPELAMRIQGENVNIGLLALSPEDLSALPRYKMDVAIAGTGNDVREIAATMNGYLYFVGGPGKVRTGAIRLYTRDFFSELLETFNPFSDTDPDLDLSCAVVLTAVDNGRLAGDPALVVQSDRVTVYADTRLDLGSERVEANIRTVPRRGLGISLSNIVSPYVKISGTLARPSVAFDPEGALIEGGIAAATGGASVVAENLMERFLRSGDPCSRAINHADGELQALKVRFGPVVSAALE